MIGNFEVKGSTGHNCILCDTCENIVAPLIQYKDLRTGKILDIRAAANISENWMYVMNRDICPDCQKGPTEIEENNG
jgi:hypothetical protein